jgi:O-methyltransferase involved in polyketide biosynthesis
MSSPSHQSHGQDAAIIHTADRAILAKLSCTERRYYEDPFVRPMSRGLDRGTSSKNNGSVMEPIIRRGTHARVKAVDRAVTAFLSLPLRKTGDCKAARQVVVLGSGRDTTYLRYRFGHLQSTSSLKGEELIRWYEVDHPSVICQKVYDWLPACIPKGYEYHRTSVKHNQTTNESYVVSIISNEQTSENSSSDYQNHKSSYHLIGHDLRHSPSNLFEILSNPQHEYDISIPTLFVLECVLMYLPEHSSRELLQYLAKSTSPTSQAFVAVVMYDPVSNHDRFGQVMIENMQKAGIVGRRRNNSKQEEGEEDTLLSLEVTRTVSDQLNKLVQCGFDVAVGCDMFDAYNHGVIPMNDARHASRCEMLDELEEFNLLMKHYCLVVGVRGGASCMGYDLCSVGEDSLMGFREGHCECVKNTK